LDQEAGKHSHSLPAGEFTVIAAGVRFGPGGRKTEPLTSCRGIHSNSSWSQIWTRRQENTVTHILQGNSQPWQLESDLDQEAGKQSHSLAAGEFTAMAAGVRFGPGGRKTEPLTSCRGIHSHGTWSQIWTRRQENTATHKLQGNSQPWQLGSELDQEAGKHNCSLPAGEFTAMAAGVRFGPGGRRTLPLTSCRRIHSHGSWSHIWTRRQENRATHFLQGNSQP
jgi:hypothetical protein